MPSPADLPNPGIELRSPALQVDILPTMLSRKPTHITRQKTNPTEILVMKHNYLQTPRSEVHIIFITNYCFSFNFLSSM